MTRLSNNDLQFIQDNPKMTKKQLLEYVKQTYKPNTAITRFYNIRNEIKKTWKAPVEFIRFRKQETSERVEQERKMISISKKEYMDFINIQPQPTDTPSIKIYKQIFILSYVSGRRIGEIINHKFYYENGTLYYTPLKKKSPKPEIIMYINFITKEEFYNKWLELSELIKDKNVKNINLQYSRWLKKVLNLTPHDLRGFYLQYTIQYVAEHSASNRENIKKLILNHNSTQATSSYDRYQIVVDSLVVE